MTARPPVALVLCWDIDGTLLLTGRAGVLAWEEALAAATGKPVDLSRLDTAGRTDWEIAADLAVRFGLGPERREELVRRYEAALPAALARKTGRVLPHVRETLEAVRSSTDILSLLLTGNTEAGGRAKLRHYGLDSYFPHGAFADGAPDRAAIARRALAQAEALAGRPVPPGRVFVIGDTPHDIACARAIGARAVAVATGSYPIEALRREAPWWALEALPPPEAFLGRLREAARDG